MIGCEKIRLARLTYPCGGQCVSHLFRLVSSRDEGPISLACLTREQRLEGYGCWVVLCLVGFWSILFCSVHDLLGLLFCFFLFGPEATGEKRGESPGQGEERSIGCVCVGRR